MKTKEAIELIRLLRDVLYDAYSIGKIYVGGTEGFERNINDIIELLQQGEKYKEMWEEFKRKDGHYLIGIKEDNRLRVGYTIGDFMAILKDKYFPKEAKQDES